MKDKKEKYNFSLVKKVYHNGRVITFGLIVDRLLDNIYSVRFGMAVCSPEDIQSFLYNREVGEKIALGRAYKNNKLNEFTRNWDLVVNFKDGINTIMLEGLLNTVIKDFAFNPKKYYVYG